MQYRLLCRGQSCPMALVDCQGLPAWGAVWLQSTALGDRLVFCVPPGGDILGVEGLSGRRFYELPSEVQEQVMSDFVARMRNACTRTVEGECPCDEGFVHQFPGVHEFLGRSKLVDGSPRTRSKITIFYDGPQVKIGITEPDMEMSAFVTADGVFEALQRLEEAIQADKLDWRRWYGNGKHRSDSKRR